MSEAGITSINVGYQNVREDDGKGNLIGQVGEFTRSDGSSGLAADVWLQEGAGKEEETVEGRGEREAAPPQVPTGEYASGAALLDELNRQFPRS